MEFQWFYTDVAEGKTYAQAYHESLFRVSFVSPFYELERSSNLASKWISLLKQKGESGI